MTALAPEKADRSGMPSTVGWHRPTLAISGGARRPCRDGRMRQQRSRCSVVREPVTSLEITHTCTLSRRVHVPNSFAQAGSASCDRRAAS